MRSGSHVQHCRTGTLRYRHSLDYCLSQGKYVVITVQFLSIHFFVGFLQFLLGFYDDKYCNFINLTIDIALIKTKFTHWKYFWWSVCSVKHTERQFGFIQQEVSCMATVKLYLPSLTTQYTSHTLNEVL